MQHSQSQMTACMKKFEDAIAKFPECAEGYALYSQVAQTIYINHSLYLYFTQKLMLQNFNFSDVLRLDSHGSTAVR